MKKITYIIIIFLSILLDFSALAQDNSSQVNLTEFKNKLNYARKKSNYLNNLLSNAMRREGISDAAQIEGLLSKIDTDKKTQVIVFDYLNEYFYNDFEKVKQLLKKNILLHNTDAGSIAKYIVDKKYKTAVAATNTNVATTTKTTPKSENTTSKTTTKTSTTKASKNISKNTVKSKNSASKEKQQITSTVYDLKEVNLEAYIRYQDSIKANIKTFFASTAFPSYDSIMTRNKQDREVFFQGMYNLKYELAKKDNQSEDFGTLLNIKKVGEETNTTAKIEESLKIILPNTYIKTYKVRTRAMYDSLNVMFIRGVTDIQINKSKGEIKYLTQEPNLLAKYLIELKYFDNKSGKYRVHYEIINVMGEQTENFSIEKPTKPKKTTTKKVKSTSAKSSKTNTIKKSKSKKEDKKDTNNTNETGTN